MKAISLLVLLAACSSKPSVLTIQESLESKRDEFRQCYLESNSYQGRHAETKGRISVQFLINSEGKSYQEKIAETSFKDANLDACIIGVLKLIKFTPPKAGETIEVKEPINFYENV